MPAPQKRLKDEHLNILIDGYRPDGNNYEIKGLYNSQTEISHLIKEE